MICILFCVLFVDAQNTELREPISEPPAIGLALSGGGAKAFAQIGVIKVLEEAGFDVKYVTGSSLGAVVGGLYAMGYSIYDIERMALAEDWESLLNDDIGRKYLNASEKRMGEQSFLTLPIKRYGIGMPAGLMSGQQYNQFLSRVSIPVSNIYNFNQLYRQFSCRATDLYTGNSVELKQGSLALAMRASTAVPTIFAPLKYHDMYLVDGGIFNNYPVEDCKNMGADVVIGINTKTHLYHKKDLYNMVNILMQSVYFNAESQDDANTLLADFNIEPDLDAYSNSDFEKVAEIIKIGEQYARDILPELLAWAKQANVKLSPKTKKQQFNQFPEIHTLYVDTIMVQGNKDVSTKYIVDNLRIKVGKPLSLKNLDKRISYLYGKQLFSAIYYHFEFLKDNKTAIVIEVHETDLLNFDFGAHYNDYSKTAILLRLSRRNMKLWFAKGLLNVSLALGRASKFKADYVVDNGWFPGYGFTFSSFDQYGYTYSPKGIKENKFDLAVFNFKAYTTLGISNVLRLRAGACIEAHIIRRNISFSNFNKVNNSGFNLYSELVFDNYNRKYFPTSGRRFSVRFEYGEGDSYTADKKVNVTGENKTNFYHYNSLELNYSNVWAFTKRWSVEPSVYYRYIWSKKYLPIVKSPFFGGANQTYLKYYHPFYGYHYQAILADNPLLVGCNLHYNVYDKHYLSVGSQLLLPDDDWTKQWHDSQKYYNWKFTYTYNSFVGPLSIAVAKAYPNNKLFFYLNLGYWF